jgi:hypothetical protein
MNKKVIIAILVVFMLVLGGAAIFIAVNLNNQSTVIPEGAKAYEFTNYSCSGSCDSGKECNKYGDPDPGKMWSCWPTNGVYKCAQSAINEGGNSCWGCPGNMQACGCDESACESACLAKIPSSGGSAEHTMLCDSCGQKFTCSCSKSSSKLVCGDLGCTRDSDCEGYDSSFPPGSMECAERTDGNAALQRCVIICPSGTKMDSTYCGCITPTVTITPSYTTTITPTITITTIPKTALINDDVDRLLIGFGMIFMGIVFYKNNLYYSSFNFFKTAFIEVPKKKALSKFEEKVERSQKK